MMLKILYLVLSSVNNFNFPWGSTVLCLAHDARPFSQVLSGRWYKMCRVHVGMCRVAAALPTTIKHIPFK